ncbi:hypothetical protein FRC03_008528 [Tulasnella sp. 419]|nr:hypothetical protein FRC03_008528 [Tulasnella sp. 419]
MIDCSPKLQLQATKIAQSICFINVSSLLTPVEEALAKLMRALKEDEFRQIASFNVNKPATCLDRLPAKLLTGYSHMPAKNYLPNLVAPSFLFNVSVSLAFSSRWYAVLHR